MSDASLKSFLDQFETSKKNVDRWPSWMQDSAKIATASFPKPQSPVEDSKEKTANLSRPDLSEQ